MDKYPLKTLFSDTNTLIITVILKGFLFGLKYKEIRSTDDVDFHLENERM